MIFVTKVENGQKKSEGLCLACAKELGLPVENMLGDAMGKMGLNMDQLSEMEADFKAAIAEGAEDVDAEDANDEAENEDGDAPAKGEHVVPTFDFRKIFEDVGLVRSEGGETPEGGEIPEDGETPGEEAPAGE